MTKARNFSSKAPTWSCGPGDPHPLFTYFHWGREETVSVAGILVAVGAKVAVAFRVALDVVDVAASLPPQANTSAVSATARKSAGEHLFKGIAKYLLNLLPDLTHRGSINVRQDTGIAKRPTCGAKTLGTPAFAEGCVIIPSRTLEWLTSKFPGPRPLC